MNGHIKMNIKELDLTEFAPDLVSLSMDQLKRKYSDPQLSEGGRKYRLEATFTVHELIENLERAGKLRMFLGDSPFRNEGLPYASYRGDSTYFYEKDGFFIVDESERGHCFDHRKFKTIEDALRDYLPSYLLSFGISLKKGV